MSEKNVPEDSEVDPEAALDPPPAFGEQDEDKQADDWEEDAREGGE